MSKELDKLNVLDLCPSSISDDETIQALANVATDALIQINSDIDKLLIYKNLHSLPIGVVDALAWQLHVDFYDDTLSREKKEMLVLNSIDWHRRKGTVGLVEEAITSIYSEAKVLENWDYGGRPYYFKLQMTGYLMDPVTREQLMRVLNVVKNKRSWLEDIEYIHEVDSNMLYIGGIATSAGSVNVEPALGVDFGEISGGQFVGGFVTVQQSIVI